MCSWSKDTTSFLRQEIVKNSGHKPGNCKLQCNQPFNDTASKTFNDRSPKNEIQMLFIYGAFKFVFTSWEDIGCIQITLL